MENENNTPTPEELQVEQESLAEVADDKLRSSVVSSLGLEDNEDNAALIEKVLEREKQHRQKLSGAISSKIKYRTLAQQSGLNKDKAPVQSKTNLDAESIRKQTEETVRAQFDEEYLEESDFSDNLKAEMRKVAKINGTTVRATTKDPYIKFLMEQASAEKRALEAANNGNGARKGTNNGGQGMPEEFSDAAYMATPEGQKAYDTWSKSNK
jgi:hypothetical protein